MKKTFTLCLMVASLHSYGQPNSYFEEYETVTCTFDNTVTINAYKDWLVYQTLDDHWNGPIDSTICISLRSIPSEGIDLQTVDIERPIFIRSKLTESNKVWLQPNYIYDANAGANYFGNNNASFQGGTDCADNFCSGIIVGIQIPDESGNSTAMRWYTDVPGADASDGRFSTCIPTEYFDDNYIREFIIKLSLAPNTSLDKRVRLQRGRLDAGWSPYYIDEVIADPSTFVDTSYNVPLYLVGYQNGPIWPAPNYLLLYTDMNSYPSSSSPAYVEARPSVNTPDPQTINLIVSDWETFIPQPFAILRGALVEGSDSIRHQVNLVNHTGDICMGGPVDFVFEDDTKYIHQGGHVNMEGLSSCMMFRNGGTFEVAEGTTMQYGQDGRGILALRSGGQLQLDKGSTLLFDGTLWLQGIPTAKHPDPQFYLDLKPGTSLIFGEHAIVLNANSISPDVKLNVYMNGGTLDDSHLSADERLLIHQIYPKPVERFSDNIKLLGNPITSVAPFEYISLGQEQLMLELYDLQGRYIAKKNYNTAEGYNRFEYDMSDMATGIYLANIKGNNGHATLKMVKL